LWADVGAILLVLFLVPTTFIMHAFWKEQDPQAEQMQMAMFMKNTALTGGALIILFLYDAYGDDAPVSLTGPLLFG
ncbi:MAG: DoxX family protein, partial [Actinomycetota bacterium]